MTPGIPNPKAFATLLTLALPVAAQTTHKPAPQQTVMVVVVNAHTQPAAPVPTVRVSLSYVDNGTRVTEAREVTSPKGEAYLTVSTDAAQRGDLRLEISGVSGLVIYQPADGQLSGLPPRITLNLLPKGSPALLGPTQIEALLHRTLLQVNSQQRQIQALKNQKPDLSAALAEVAQAYGFPTADFDKQIQQWAQQVQSDPGADPRRKALAEVALKHYAEAAQLFTQATNADAADMDADEQKFLEARRTKLRQLLTDAQQSANASQLNLQYHQATTTLEAARDRAAAEQKRYPDDRALRNIWLDAILALATSRWEEGEIAPAPESLSLLAEAADNFQSLAREYLATGDRANWATTQNRLGNALCDEGIRASGENSIAFLEQAMQAYRRALEFRTKADLPQDWAATQNNLGLALVDEAMRRSKDQSIALFEQAVAALQHALEVRTKADFPQDWATTQNNLGLALSNEGERASRDKAAALFDRAVLAFRSALEIRTKAYSPKRWSDTENNLGISLMREGECVDGDAGTALFDQAVLAFRNALEVRTKAALPQDWALTQNNLGLALTDEGERAGDEQADALFDSAVQAFRYALEVYTRADMPRGWAMTQLNLGIALWNQGTRASGDKAAALFDQAAQVYRNAQSVYTKTDDPFGWAMTMRDLSFVYKSQGNTAAAQQALADANSVDPH